MADICVLCGKKLGLTSRDKLFNLSRFCGMYVSDSFGICKDCAELLRPLRNVVSDFSVEKNIPKYMNDRKKLMAYIGDSPAGGSIKEAISNQMIKADDAIHYYENSATIVSTLVSNLSAFFDNMKNCKFADYEDSTVVRRNDELFFFDLGRPLANEAYIQSQLNKLGIMQQNAVLKTFKERIDGKKWFTQISVSDIIYYQDKGDISYSTSVTGGEINSKGVSIGGAVVGGLLFGGAGAIVGSKVGTGVKSDGVRSIVNEHDNRYVAFRYYDEERNIQEKEFPYGFFDVFNQLIPEKEYGYVSYNGKAEKENNTKQISSGSDEIIEQLKKLKELTDQGVLTQEEFEAKKKQLLGI